MGDVNWKASARMNRIITNEFLPEEPPRYMIYVDTRMTGSERGEPDVFERSLELASVLVEALIQARAQVGLVTVSFHSVFLVPGAGQGQLARLRSMLQNCQPGPPAPIRELVLSSLAHVPARAEALLVTSNVYDGSLRDALTSLDTDRDFLKKGDVMTDDLIDGYLALKWDEVYAFEHSPHPIEYQMYYSV